MRWNSYRAFRCFGCGTCVKTEAKRKVSRVSNADKAKFRAQRNPYHIDCQRPMRRKGPNWTCLECYAFVRVETSALALSRPQMKTVKVIKYETVIKEEIQDGLLKRIDEVVPRRLYREDREEIKQEMMIAVLTAVDEVLQRGPEFVKAHNRSYPTFQHRSIDDDARLAESLVG